MPETTPIPKIDLEELKKFKEQNFKERLEFIEKYAEWVKWFASYDPVYPPGSLLAIIFVGLVLLLRASVLVIDLAQKDRYSSKIIKND